MDYLFYFILLILVTITKVFAVAIGFGLVYYIYNKYFDKYITKES